MVWGTRLAFIPGWIAGKKSFFCGLEAQNLAQLPGSCQVFNIGGIDGTLCEHPHTCSAHPWEFARRLWVVEAFPAGKRSVRPSV